MKNISKMLCPVIAVALAFICIFGIITFSVSFDSETATLNSKSPLTVIFTILIVLAFVGITALAIILRRSETQEINKKAKFVYISSAVAAAFMLSSFISDVVCIAGLDKAYSSIGIMRTVLSVAVCIYFAQEALIGFKGIMLPTIVRQLLSASTMLWALLGIFDVYFTTNKALLSTSVFFNALIIAYVVLSLFFVFDAEREFTKLKFSVLLASSLIAALVSAALFGSVTVCVIIGTVPVSHIGISFCGYLSGLGIGVFALSRAFSLLKPFASSEENE